MGSGAPDRAGATGTSGGVLRWALAYDLLLWLLTRGRERAFRERLVDLARLGPEESVLDVGCGTGTLAIAAERRVGPAGRVMGIDPSPEMIRRARRKARRVAPEVTFAIGAAERLPLPDAAFDAVLAVAVLHHLPGAVRPGAIGEMRRVLKPGGRLLVVDFGGPAAGRRSWIAHLGHHARFDLREVVPLLAAAGLAEVAGGEVGASVPLAKGLRYVLAAAPSGC